MGAVEIMLGFALLAGLAIILVGLYSLGLQRKAVGTQDDAMDNFAYSVKLQEEGIEHTKRSLELQIESHQLAQEAVALQRENNTLLRELLSQSGNHQTKVE